MHENKHGIAASKLWKDSYTLYSFLVDTEKQASLISLCNFFQNSAADHAAAAGVGFDDFIRDGYIWVLSRFYMEVYAYPCWRQQIELETWSRGADRLFAMRDFRIRGPEGDVAAAGTSGWMILDLEKRRPVRPQGIMDRFPNLLEDKAVEQTLDKIPLPAEDMVADTLKVKYSDLDMQQHVNNTRYVDWVINSYPADFLKTREAASIEMNFLQEGLPGDDVTIHGDCRTDSHILTIQSGPRELCRVRLNWRERAAARPV